MTDLLSIPQNYALFRLSCPHYDELQNGVGRAVAEVVRNSPVDSRRVADIGCGLGDTTRAVVRTEQGDKQHIPTLYAYLVDTNPEIRTFAKKLLLDVQGEIIHQDAVTFLELTDSNYPFACIYSAWTLHNWHFEKRKDFLREARKALRKGGSIVIVDKILPDDRGEQMTAYHQQEEWFGVFDTIFRPELREAWRMHYLEDLHPLKVWYEKEALYDLRHAGFKNVQALKRWNLELLITGEKG